jgi:hypothetical protein
MAVPSILRDHAVEHPLLGQVVSSVDFPFWSEGHPHLLLTSIVSPNITTNQTKLASLLHRVVKLSVRDRNGTATMSNNRLRQHNGFNNASVFEQHKKAFALCSSYQ